MHRLVAFTRAILIVTRARDSKKIRRMIEDRGDNFRKLRSTINVYRYILCSVCYSLCPYANLASRMSPRSL